MHLRAISLSVCTVGLLVAGLVAGPPSVAAGWEPVGGAVFNNPQGTHAAQWRIIHHVEQAIGHTPRGATIRISSFLMDHAPTGAALVRARKRGVRVQVVLDGEQGRTPLSTRLARILNKDNLRSSGHRYDADGIPIWAGKDKSFVVFCKGPCRGPGAVSNNHAKLYTFSRTGTAKNVVMVSSSNLNIGGALRGWNDLFTIKRNPQMYRYFGRVHAEMAADKPARYHELVSGRFTYRAFPMGGTGDPTLADLAKVKCRGATGGAGRNGRTAITISMFAWRAERGRRIARRILDLDRRGCDVSVIYGAPGKEVGDMLRRSARHGGIKLWDSRHDTDGDGIFDVRVHEKYLLISGVYGRDTSAWRVHTGTQNWSTGIRGDDDLTLSIVGRGAYAQYLAHWRSIAKYGARRVR